MLLHPIRDRVAAVCAVKVGDIAEEVTGPPRLIFRSVSLYICCNHLYFRSLGCAHIAGDPLWTVHSTLVFCRAGRGIPRVDGWAAGQQRVGLGVAAIVREIPQFGIERLYLCADAIANCWRNGTTCVEAD